MNHDFAFCQTHNAFLRALLVRHQVQIRLARFGDHDLLAFPHQLAKLRKLGLGFMHIYFHLTSPKLASFS